MKLLSRNEEIILLAIWRLEGNAYGVTIRQQVSQVTGHKWTFGAVYVPLDKLTRKEYIIKIMSQPTTSRGGRSKCLYELSPKGKRVLKEMRAVNEALWKGIPSIAFD